MVLLPDGRAKIRAEGYAKGWAEGYAEGRAELARIRSAWLSWNARRLDSESRGESFDEPPPAPPDGYRNGKGDDSGNE